MTYKNNRQLLYPIYNKCNKEISTILRINNMNQSIGRFLIITGAAAVIIGILFVYGEKFPVFKYLGKLPGDIKIQKENFSFYFPITTCIILSIIVTLILRIIAKFR